MACCKLSQGNVTGEYIVNYTRNKPPNLWKEFWVNDGELRYTGANAKTYAVDHSECTKCKYFRLLPVFTLRFLGLTEDDILIWCTGSDEDDYGLAIHAFRMIQARKCKGKHKALYKDIKRQFIECREEISDKWTVDAAIAILGFYDTDE